MTTPLAFQRVALMGRQRGEGIAETLISLKSYLRQMNVEVVFEQETAAMVPSQNKASIPGNELGKHVDLIIVVGGDGSLLRASHIAIKQNLPVLGINRGRLGFLTDIRPEEFSKIGNVLEGEYLQEERFLLNCEVEFQNKILASQDALNDVVLLPGAVAHMIEFTIYIDHKFVCNQRADGQIVATPTGSTAYALSGGGPILHPGLNAIVLVPMFPHMLSSRPIVISANSQIEIHIDEDNEVPPAVSNDGQERIIIPPGGKIKIQKRFEHLRLIHPKDYNYFETLRTKLGWVTKQ